MAPPKSGADFEKGCGFADLALTILEAKYGLGRPITTVDLPDIIKVLKYTTFAIFVNGLSMGFLKIGIGIGLLRLRLSKVFNYAVIIAVLISSLVNFIVFPGTFGQCRPLAKQWNPSLPGNCWSKKTSLAFSYTQTCKFTFYSLSEAQYLTVLDWQVEM
jgi:hypothetical protein